MKFGQRCEQRLSISVFFVKQAEICVVGYDEYVEPFFCEFTNGLYKRLCFVLGRRITGRIVGEIYQKYGLPVPRIRFQCAFEPGHVEAAFFVEKRKLCDFRFVSSFENEIVILPVHIGNYDRVFRVDKEVRKLSNTVCEARYNCGQRNIGRIHIGVFPCHILKPCGPERLYP